jgi:hypothetical protein
MCCLPCDRTASGSISVLDVCCRPASKTRTDGNLESSGREREDGKTKKKKKKKQVDIKLTQEGIGHCHKPAGQVKAEQLDGKWRKDEKHRARNLAPLNI